MHKAVFISSPFEKKDHGLKPAVASNLQGHVSKPITKKGLVV
jgi:hypothetical protein